MISQHSRRPLKRGNSLKAVLCGLLLIWMSSCTVSREQVLFQDIPADTTIQQIVSNNLEPKIQPNDALSIVVTSLSPENTLIYNAPPNIFQGKPAYIVDKQGYIEFIKLGRIKAAGLTVKEFKKLLEAQLQPYLSQNVVTLGILNHHVTLVGSASPQIIPLEMNNMTLLDVLAVAGSIENMVTKDILVIREKEGGKEFKRLNLTDKSIFYSPYYYMQPNDIVYIQSNPKNNTSAIQIISYVTTGITFIIFLMDRVFK